MLVILALLATACAARRAGVDPATTSGFLDDYSRLRRGAEGDLPFVYRNPDARWTSYRKVLLEPVTLWRSGRDSLAPIPQEELLRLVSDFEAAVARRLGRGFELVDTPSPGTLRMRLAITEARASDKVLDVLTAVAEPGRHDTPEMLSPELRRFIESAEIEGELRDAETDVLLAQGLDRRRKNAPPIATWTDLDRALAFWVERACARLETRTGVR